MTVKDFTLLALVIVIASASNVNTRLLTGKYEGQCCDYKTITVFGSGQVQANPDQAILQASITRNGATVAQAIENLSVAANNITSILNSSGLTTDNYYTTGFSVYPNTSYVNGTSVVIGQIAYESFQIIIPFADVNGSNIGLIIDALAAVNGIIISGLGFDIANKTDVYQLARAVAYTNAQQKATDYTQALGLNLTDLVSLVDNFGGAPVVTPSQQDNKFMQQQQSTPTQINVGTITISYYLEAVFGFK